MKRWLLFIVLFLVGLGILLWIDRGRKPAPRPPTAEQSTGSATGQAPLVPIKLGDDHTASGASRGFVSWSGLDPESGKALFRISAADSESLGDGLYRFDKLVARFFVKGTEEMSLEVTAERARGRLSFTASPYFDPQHPVELDGVVAVMFTGSPFVPMTLRVPRASGTFADQKFSSDERVTIEGKGLSASGVGLSFDGVARELVLRRETRATMVLEDGSPATLSADGGLWFTALEKLGEGASRVVARERAHMTFEGKNPVVLDAELVELDALVEPKPSMHVRPTLVKASGSVRIKPEDGSFFGDEATLELGEDGRPQRATLRGGPRVELVLRGVDASAVPGVEGALPADLAIQVVGAGPLDVGLATNARFDFRGPATVLLPALDLTLTAQDKLSGARQSTGEFTRLDATGLVQVNWADSTLETEALSIERRLARDGQPIAVLSSPGSTHASGALRDGSPFDLTARGGLELELAAKLFRLPVARDVDLVVGGKNKFQASVAEVRDFDELTGAFVGLGGVSFENEKGRGRGEQLVVESRESAELMGSPTKPARCELDQGWLEARSIRFSPDQMRAEGEARADIGLDGAHYTLDSRWISVARTPEGEGEELRLDSAGDVAASVEDSKGRLQVSASSVNARAWSPGKELEKLESRGLSATGNVEFQTSGEQIISGSGEQLVINADRSGHLRPSEGGRVQMRGQLPERAVTFELGAGVVSFSPSNITAQNPVITLDGIDVPLGLEHSGAQSPLRAIAGSLSVDPTSILFTEGVYLAQEGAVNFSWSLDAENLVLTGEEQPDLEGGGKHFSVSTALAWGGFQAVLADQGTARGDSLLLDRAANRVTIRGTPAEFDRGGQRLRTDWLELELDTGFLRSSRGTWVPLEESEGAYVVSFESMEPVDGLDSRVQVVREIKLVEPAKQREIRAAWALLWLDEERLRRLSAKALREPGAEDVAIDAGPLPQSTSDGPAAQKLRTLGVARWVREIYLEGNIEMFLRGERRIRADAVYMNLLRGDGWVRDIDITMEDLPHRAVAKRLKLHADWMRLSSDGTARAEGAVVTSCEHEEPHYTVSLGDLRMKLRRSEVSGDGRVVEGEQGNGKIEGYNITSRDNSVSLSGGPGIPLPPLEFSTDAEFRSEAFSFFGLRPMDFGSSARFGAFIGLSIDLPLDWASEQVGRLLGSGKMKPKGGNTPYVRYLHSRGLLVGGKNTIEERGVYKLTTRVDFIDDHGRDRGLVRDDDRDSLRTWLRMSGRRVVSSEEWFDFNLTGQTDAGVQAEFFEGDFLGWEERETYVHWRRAQGLDYTRATAETQVDDYRSEVLEQPSVGYTRARGPLASWWDRDLLYTSDTTISRLRRMEGDVRVDPSGNRIIQDPFGVQILDGHGDEEASRLDTTQRWELPVPLGILNARLVPFIEGRATAWDRGATESEAPSRAGLFGGAEATTTFWRLYGDGDIHTLTPSLGFRGELAAEQSGPTPARFDVVEDPIEGTLTEIGLRSRWVKPSDLGRADAEERFLDIELRETYASGLQSSRDDGWQPLRVNAQWLTAVMNMPFGVTHDGRYDLNASETVYSRSLVGVRPIPSLELQAGFDDALDLAGDRLYSAWSVGARYDFSSKWQFEGRETVSTRSGNQLSSGVLLRRLGHDFIFEIQYSYTAGEGGSSVSFGLIPLLAYRERRFGYLSRWQSVGN